jgi:type I site-specific restriction-modification system R (restriction) subunit
MMKEDLDSKFKDPDDPFRIVFVCAMWMTGFDVPCCSTIYLDKPMRNHTLMQTIARANRVFGEKKNGLIVAYLSIFRSLEKALAIYGSGSGGGVGEGETPIKDKSELVEELKKAITEAAAFCAERGIDLSKIDAAAGFEKVKLLTDAVGAILADDEAKTHFLNLANTVRALYKAILPDPAANEEQEIKKAARELLATLKREKLVLDWRKRQQSRADVRLAIDIALDHALPPTVPAAILHQKCALVYQHIYDSYYGQGQSVYAQVA